MKELPVDVLFNEINEAIEKGVAEAKEQIANSPTIFVFREVLLGMTEVCAGYIGKAICDIFKKYTEVDNGN